MINRKVPTVRFFAASFWLTVFITLFAVPSQGQQGRSFAGGGVAGQVIAGVRMEYGTDRSGATYRKLPTQSPEQCARECGADPRCVAMDYNYGHKYCSLKNRITPPRARNGAVSGVKINSGGTPQPQPPPPRQNQQIGRVAGMQITPNMKRFGGDYRDFRVNNMEECARVCAQDHYCQSFNFGIQRRDCWLKNTLPQGVPDARFISGYK